jgi:hypothetical protein
MEGAMLKRSFSLGQVVATPGALSLLAEHGIRPDSLLQRHACGDWGELDAEDWKANDAALAHGDGRLFSSYQIEHHKIWVITESDWSTTCLILPQDY